MSKGGILKVSSSALQRYLSSVFGSNVKIRGLWVLGGEKVSGIEDLKGFGYGHPYAIEFILNGEIRRVVLETLRSEGFGHDNFADRAQILLWQHSAFGKLDKHVSSLDVGAFSSGDGCLISLGKCSEFFILTDFIDGTLYHIDLDHIRETDELSDQDKRRCLAMSDYLVHIHKAKREAPWLYVRRARELVGHGECIMGLLDSYPPKLHIASEAYLIGVEKAAINSRWRLKRKAHRLSQVHGDFHPWNVLFHTGVDFTVLDRSRGEWGEPADDVTAMTVNYLFYSLQKHGELAGAFKRLFELFWENYLNKTGDREILEVAQPFYAWRGLVVASPIWYPKLEKSVRVKLLNFVKNVLGVERFDLKNVNSYLE